jgi:hypothetical protein
MKPTMYSLGWRSAWCVLFSLLIEACALTYVDDQGAKHVLGLVNMKIEPQVIADQTLAESVQIQSVGVSIYSTPINSGMALGYNNEWLAIVYDNVVVGNSGKMPQ